MSFVLSINKWYNALLYPNYERTIDGNHWNYAETGDPNTKTSNLVFATSHPILTPAILFIANLFAQAKFEIKNKTTGEIVKDHFLLRLLNNPNYLQTRIDFLEQLQFLKVAQGKTGILLKRGIGIEEPDSLFIIREDLITYPEDFKTGFLFEKRKSKVLNMEIIYDQGGENEMKIKLKDIIFLYDLPQTDSKNMLKGSSRLDGLQQTLVNTVDSLIAKNVILKSNGKEMLSGGTGVGGFPFDPTEQDEAKKIWNGTYGLAFGRSRVYMTRSNVNWKSLHIALRDLGLDESVKVDGNLIYTALHIPKDILSLEAKKTTYANFKESMTSFIQNDIQAMLNDFVESIQPLLGDDNLELIGSYEHLPVMQFLLKQKYESISLQAKALNDLLITGIPKEDALERTDFPRNMKLGPLQAIQGSSNNSSGNSNNSDPEENR